MMRRLVTTLLTLAFLLTPVPARAADEEKLTDAEGREACDLARQVVERLREDNDVTPLVRDLFLGDFVARLRHERDNIPMAFVTPEVAARASEEELRHFYIAEFNFFSRTLAYLMALPPDKDEEDEECDDVCEMERMYPPEVFRVLKDDPIFSGMMAMEKAEPSAAKEGEQTPSGEVAVAESKPQPDEGEDATFVKDLVMLRAATGTTMKAAELMRAYTPEFLALRRVQEADGREYIVEEVHQPHLETYEKDYFGFPPGTRFVRIHVEPAYDIEFELIMVTEGGRLQILFAVPILGD